MLWYPSNIVIMRLWWSYLPPSSGVSLPANILIKVVFPVPFSPNITTISESVNWPFSTFISNEPEEDMLQHQKMYLRTCAQGRFRSACALAVYSSESSLGTFWIAKGAKFLHADNEDSVIRLCKCTDWFASLLSAHIEGTFSDNAVYMWATAWRKLSSRQMQTAKAQISLGQVVQSIVSLMISLVVKMLTVLVSTISNSQVFLLKKKCEATHIFSAKY